MTVVQLLELIGAVLTVVGGVIGLIVVCKKKGGVAGLIKSITQKGSKGSTIINAEGSTIALGNSVAVSGGHSNGAGANPEPQSENASQSVFTSEDTLDTIRLNNIYTSLFAEDNQLKSERIVITRQHQGCVEGYVELTEKDTQGHTNSTLTYCLKGIFANKVLTAEYTSKENRNDERGAINLKLIGSDMLSGFCSFSKSSSTMDDEIRVSPYVWVSGENIDLLDGTYDFCTQCYKEKAVCCCASEDIDMPVFLESEARAIQAKQNKRKKSLRIFSKNLPQPFQDTNVRQILRNSKEDTNASAQNIRCHFFDYDSKECKIYSCRPLDCRLFPFDIKLAKNKSEYVIGYYTDLCDRELPEHNTMLRYAHILRPYFFLLYPYLHIITSDLVCERLKDAEFKQLANFKDFVF